MYIQRSTGEKAFTIFNGIFMAFLCFVTIYPFWYIIVYSFNNVLDSKFGGLFFWPRDFTTASYELIFKMGGILQAYFVSIMRVIVAVPLHLFITGMCAYALSREKIVFKNFLITVFFITMLFRGGLIPDFLLFSSIGLIDTFAVFVLPVVFSVWNFMIFKTMFKTTVPESLVESALMDGAGFYKIFIRIVIPLSLPVFAALGFFNAVYHWNDWFVGIFFINNIKITPLQSFIRSLIGRSGGGSFLNVMMYSLGEFDVGKISPFSATMAAVAVSVVPILLVYPFFQKYFIKGVMIGAIKG